MKPSLYTIAYLGYWHHGEGLTMDKLLERYKTHDYEGLMTEGRNGRV